MDIIDIILARAKSFTGETATLVQQAQAAMSDANDIVDRLEAIEQNAADASEVATAAAEELAEIKADFETAANAVVAEQLGTTVSDVADLKSRTTALESQIANAGGTVTIVDANTSSAKIKQANITKNGTTTNYVVEKNYTSEGTNEDGSMTQKAIKTYVEEVKNTLQSQINSSGGNSGGTTNLGANNAGQIVIVGPEGTIVAGDTSELEIIELLLRTGTYQAKDAVGLNIDYENKSVGRTQEATSNTDFSTYSMYKRMRCNVADNGTITAFYGDNNYKEDGSNGQVMVYQPKFYYQRVPINTTNNTTGKIVHKESLIISPTAQSGFKLHPAFIDANGNTLEYILLSAYEGSAYDTSANEYLVEDIGGVDFSEDKLSSIANVQPISGKNNALTIDKAEQLARNRGEGWHIETMQTRSADQMLSIIEYGTLNIQDAIESGVCSINNSYDRNYANNTGSTAALGNNSGAAASSINTMLNTTYSTNGKRCISYRGEENPFGNIWKFIGNVNISGDGVQQGGIPYICTNYNYATTITDDYESVGFCLPNNSDWLSGMGYGNEKYDWVFLPAAASGANSATPIGDSVWVTPNLDGLNYVAHGGNWLFQQKDGIFYYACDKDPSYYAAPFGARLVYIPTRNSIHDNNYALWQSKIGG